MPQVFKSRRNILRAANKSKREHFTQDTNYQALDDHIDGLTKKLNNLKTEKDAFKEYTDQYGLNEIPGGFMTEIEKNAAELALLRKINIISEFINELASTYSITGVDTPYEDINLEKLDLPVLNSQVEDGELLDHVNTIITKAQKILSRLNIIKQGEPWASMSSLFQRAIRE